MNKKLFDDLCDSVRQMNAIRRGAPKPSRRFVVQRAAIDVKAIRGKLHQSQTEFAALLGVSPATLRNWEQRRRHPSGAALVLLKVAARNPEIVADVVGARIPA